MAGKVPPHDQNAEQSVLGAILIDPSAMSMVIEILNADSFYFDSHKKLFTAMLSLFEKHQPIDLVTISSELKDLGHLKAIGGTDFIAELIDKVPTSAHIEQYARIVKSDAIKRTLITTASRLVEKAFDEGAEIKSLLNLAESEIFALSQAYLHRDFIELRSILAESFDRLEKLVKEGAGIRGLSTGFEDLDRKLAGMHDSNLLILAARPGVGKTTMALNIALHVAMHDRAPVGIFSLEMSQEELVDRLLVGQADIDAWRLKTGKLTDDDYTRITEAMGDLSEAPIYIDDTPGASVLDMHTKARKLKLEKGLKFLIVDYLQLVDPGKRIEGRVQEVSFISQQLKNIARELKIPVMALSQLSRAVEHRGEKKPQLADLRDSGSIEQDSDVVMFIYSEKAHEELLDETMRPVKLYIAKHRNGPTGEIDLMFRGDRVKFYGVEQR
ncbi:replicative DNA helicase [Candidatus Roizmanbacteria bacterium RIFCSPHIGHO2_01_FULL_39_12b]|uniref:Replicative DNA helicase n=1 Tax=Candidatus Roizmanbacteria bacterium RIFCSPHIGHO2_01_FULL_39_12b TaxID=1802030 RepID=A0A1F7GBJ0_9BACT|nr:MAG: replicative DNA helicase [Candidatus Roizmanbacteria bacterium RIFCSPHIGHO2_01_FULL_39_12b]